MSEPDNQSKNTPWIAGIIGSILIAAIPALLGNWDKIFPKNENQQLTEKSKPTETPGKDFSPSLSSATTLSNSTKQKFYVIAGESNYLDNLKKEPIRAAGSQVYQSFPNIKICSSKVEQNKYYLVIDSGLSQSEAEAIKQQAITNNFRQDTYIQPEQEAFFTPKSCTPLK